MQRPAFSSASNSSFGARSAGAGRAFTAARPARGPVVVDSALIWMLAAASLGYWLLKLGEGGASVSTAAVAAPVAPPLAADARALARLLGATDAPPAPSVAASSRFALQGVVRGGASGAVLVSVDGKPARPVRVGMPVEGYVLQSIGARSATFGAQTGDAAGFTIELPALPVASTADASAATGAASPPALNPDGSTAGILGAGGVPVR